MDTKSNKSVMSVHSFDAFYLFGLQTSLCAYFIWHNLIYKHDYLGLKMTIWVGCFTPSHCSMLAVQMLRVFLTCLLWNCWGLFTFVFRLFTVSCDIWILLSKLIFNQYLHSINSLINVMWSSMLTCLISWERMHGMRNDKRINFCWICSPIWEVCTSVSFCPTCVIMCTCIYAGGQHYVVH